MFEGLGTMISGLFASGAFLVIPAVFIGVIVVTLFLAMSYRRVVPTNEVHTVQSKKKTTAYGRGLEGGNVYYEWPAWLPIIGITKIGMPTSIFDIDLDGYDAYDQDRLPFTVDVKGFFQVDVPETAAQRVKDFRELRDQLENILKGAIRSILANSELESILGQRSEFGDKFTAEVEGQLSAWGVKSVKNIELMDIRDAKSSQVIENIMAKKKSEIEKDSRIEVAENMKLAELAEIDNTREAEVRKQDALKQQGEAEASKTKAVGIADEKAQQEIKEEAKTTAEKDMAVIKVEQEREADINKNVATINAEKDKEVKRLAAEATLIEETKDAEAIKLQGEAKAEAEKLMQMAPISAQIELAKEIGANDGYMNYLLGLDGIKAGENVGIAKAEAMAKGDLKIIANAGTVEKGVSNMMDIFSSQGGMKIGSMLETMAQTPMGKELLTRITGAKPEVKEADEVINME
jgi:flotillin